MALYCTVQKLSISLLYVPQYLDILGRVGAAVGGHLHEVVEPLEDDHHCLEVLGGQVLPDLANNSFVKTKKIIKKINKYSQERLAIADTRHAWFHVLSLSSFFWF